MRQFVLVVSLVSALLLGPFVASAPPVAAVAPPVAAVVSPTISTVIAKCAPFVDVTASDAHCKSIAWLKDQKITKPADGRFRASDPVTRGAMTAMLYRFIHPGKTAPACTTKPFNDVSTTNKFCRYIAWAKTNKIAFGHSDGTFRPRDIVSRGAMAAFLHRIINDGAASKCVTKPAKDVSVNSKFCGVISWMVETKLTSGVGCGYYGTNWAVSRGAMAAFLHRASTDLKRQGPKALAAKPGCVQPIPSGEIAKSAARTQHCPVTARACIDLSKDLSWLQRDGEVIYGPVAITSGMPGLRTRPGNWRVYWKSKHHVSSIYGTPMPNSLFFDGGIAFHQGSLREVSHGCIHLSWQASQKYWDTLNYGDSVYVFGRAPY